MILEFKEEFDSEYDLDFCRALKAEHLELLGWLESAIGERKSFSAPDAAGTELRKAMADALAGKHTQDRTPAPSSSTVICLYDICKDSIQAELKARALAWFRKLRSVNSTLRAIALEQKQVIEDTRQRVWVPYLRKLWDVYSLEVRLKAHYAEYWTEMESDIRNFVNEDLAIQLVWPVADGGLCNHRLDFPCVRQLDAVPGIEADKAAGQMTFIEPATLRKQYEFSAERLAERAGVHVNTVKNFRKGKTISAENRRNILRATAELRKKNEPIENEVPSTLRTG
jgi:hypothetical protein